jgi:hypothetical protein
VKVASSLPTLSLIPAGALNTSSKADGFVAKRTGPGARRAGCKAIPGAAFHGPIMEKIRA